VEFPFDPRDEELREECAMAAYYRDREGEAAIDRERNLNPEVTYLCLRWEDLSDISKRPYRTAVAVVCDLVLAAAL
jgi:hypothetical protein